MYLFIYEHIIRRSTDPVNIYHCSRVATSDLNKIKDTQIDWDTNNSKKNYTALRAVCLNTDVHYGQSHLGLLKVVIDTLQGALAISLLEYYIK